MVTMGDNKEAQLGLGHTKDSISEPCFVKKISDKYVTVKIVQVNPKSKKL